ncbi:MAG: MATE family efflux transporter, partial [Novosphingobium sp.]
AATVRIGQSWGANDVISARRVLAAALGLTGLISIITAVLGIVFAETVLDLLATPGAAHDQALAYLQVVFIANPVTTITTMIAMGLRGSGDAATPLRFMILATVLDVALNPVLILGLGPAPALGIAGSAWAMVIATTIALIAMLVWIYAKDVPLRLRGAELAWLRPRWEDTRYLLSRGLPMGAQMLVIAGAGVIMIGLVNREGLIVAAAYGALLQIWNYIGMPAMAIGAA